MQPWLRLPCSRCGAELAFNLRDAGKRRRCPDCQAPIYVPRLGKPVKPRSLIATNPTTDSCVLIWAVGAAAALVLAPATWWILQNQEDAKAADRANQAVAAQVVDARAEVSRQRLDKAAALLQTALATEKATRLEEAHALLIDIRSQEAAKVLRSAESALAKRDAAQASHLLQTYLGDPYGGEHDKAVQLKDQLELATSDAEAANRLHRLTYSALAEFARTGTLADLDDIKNPDVRAIHLDKLRGYIASEMRQREEENTRRGLRIQATPVFGEFQDFVVLARRRLLAKGGQGEIDKRLLARLFRELNVNDAADQERILMTLGTRPLDNGEAEKISRMRANLKERFRAYKDFDKTDWEIFDWVVDREMTNLLQDLQGAAINALPGS